jgi:exoribonuclease R
MLKTNALIANILKSHHSGIFRTVQPTIFDENQSPDQRPGQHQHEWNTYHRGKYQLYDPNTDLSHAALHLPEYIHITSPIRRLVDIINQIILYDTALRSFYSLSENSLNFLQKWTNVSEIDRINQQMQSIQKIQTECFLLWQFTEKPEMLKRPYRGTVVECSENKHTIYLYDFRLFCSVKHGDESWTIGSEHEFKIFVFKDENTFHKKIKVSMVK